MFPCRSAWGGFVFSVSPSLLFSSLSFFEAYNIKRLGEARADSRESAGGRTQATLGTPSRPLSLSRCLSRSLSPLRAGTVLWVSKTTLNNLILLRNEWNPGNSIHYQLTAMVHKNCWQRCTPRRSQFWPTRSCRFIGLWPVTFPESTVISLRPEYQETTLQQDHCTMKSPLLWKKQSHTRLDELILKSLICDHFWKVLRVQSPVVPLRWAGSSGRHIWRQCCGDAVTSVWQYAFSRFAGNQKHFTKRNTVKKKRAHQCDQWCVGSSVATVTFIISVKQKHYVTTGAQTK